MDTKFTIKNFRVFDENGVTFDLKPLTILTGCNSSGKSSIVKALLLLNDFLSQIKNAIDKGNEVELADYKIDFYKYPLNLLGRFDKTVHEGSENHRITMEYVTYSRMISKDVTVQLVFAADANDGLNNAYLHRITISTVDGVVYASDRNEPVVCNLNIIKDAFLEFLPMEFAVHNYCGLESAHEFGWFNGNEIADAEYESQKKEMLSYLGECEKTRLSDVLKYVRSAKQCDSIVGRHKIDLKVPEWTIQNGSLFRIPVIDRLNTVAKDSIMDFVDKELLQNKSKEEVFASHKILKDFVNSDFITFGDYFKQFENQYLEQVNEYHEDLHMFREEGLSLFGWKTSIEEQLYSRLCIYDEPKLKRFGKIGKAESEEEKNLRHSKEIQEWEARPISFGMVYEVVMGWNYTAGSEGETVYYDIKMCGLEYYEHRMISLLDDFARLFIQEVVCPDWCGQMEYVSSSRAEVKRLYTLDTKDQFSELLKRYFEAKRKLGPDDSREAFKLSCNPYKINGFINKWIQRFDIGKSISAEPDSDGVGIKIWIIKDNDKKSLLADEGFGLTQLVSILLQIETAILSAKGKRINYYEGLEDLDGYDAGFQYEINTIAVEEPEIHLHPAYQSLLADMMVEAYKKYNVHFIVETHSEYLIRKLQVLVAGKGNEEDLQISNDEISILYANPPKTVEETGEPQVKQIGIQEDGRLDSPFGTGFFDEADNQAMELLRIKAIGK